MGVGPSTKETSLHHFRDPLIEVLGEDEGIDLMGVLVFGSPEGNEEKIRCSRTAAVLEHLIFSSLPSGDPNTRTPIRSMPGSSPSSLIRGSLKW